MIKRTPADIWFSKCIREADEWTCQRCSKKYPRDAKGIECSHFYSRGQWSIRFDPLNAEALCTGCHFIEGGHQRIAEMLDDDQQALLLERKNDLALGKAYRKTKGKGNISKHYKAEYERMLELRGQGATGYIEFKRYQEKNNLR